MSMRLIKAKDIIESRPDLGRLKAKSMVYQVDKDSILASALAEALFSTTPVRARKTSGKLVIHLKLGGIMAIEFEDVEHLSPSNNLP